MWILRQVSSLPLILSNQATHFISSLKCLRSSPSLKARRVLCRQLYSMEAIPWTSMSWRAWWGPREDYRSRPLLNHASVARRSVRGPTTSPTHHTEVLFPIPLRWKSSSIRKPDFAIGTPLRSNGPYCRPWGYPILCLHWHATIPGPCATSSLVTPCNCSS